MTSEYQELEFEQDPDELADDAFAYLQEQIPGWRPNAANLDTLTIETAARMAAVVATIAAIVPPAIFRTFGEKILRIPPEDPTPAIAQTVWTMRDNAGYTVPAGTTVGIDGQGFEVITTFSVPAGSTTSGTITLQAIDEGAAGSGLTGTPELIDLIDYVSAITLSEPTSGGSDGETNEEYQNKLANLLQILSMVPILPRDFEVLMNTVEGVDRSLAIDGYNPTDGTVNNERMIAIAAVDSLGEDVGSATRTAGQTLLESRRETNFVVRTFAPTYTTIAVEFTAVAYPGQDLAAVEAAAVDAVQSYLSPANWGQPHSGELRDWVETNVVRHREVASVLDRVEGLDYVSVLRIAIQGGALAENVDVNLAGRAAMPRPGTITGSVVAP